MAPTLIIDPEKTKNALESMAENYAMCERKDSMEDRIKQAYLDGGREIWIVARAEGRVQGLDVAIEEVMKIGAQESSPLVKRLKRVAEIESKKHDKFLFGIGGEKSND